MLCATYTYREYFGIQATIDGYKWQEFGAEGWSEPYRTLIEAQMAIDREFPCEAITLSPTD